MIDVTIKMTVPVDKRNEVLITIKDLLGLVRYAHGCISCHCYVDVEEEDVIIFKQEWQDNKALASHFKSGHFKVLQGAMKLLSIEPEIQLNIVVAVESVAATAAAQWK